mgnify:CR=1 FL=1
MADNTQEQIGEKIQEQIQKKIKENVQAPQGLVQTILNWIKNNIVLTISGVVVIIAVVLYFLKLPPFAPVLPGTDLSEFR